MPDNSKTVLLRYADCLSMEIQRSVASLSHNPLNLKAKQALDKAARELRENKVLRHLVREDLAKLESAGFVAAIKITETGQIESTALTHSMRVVDRNPLGRHFTISLSKTA